MDRSTREIILSDDVLQDEGTFRKNKWFFSLGGIGRDMVYTLVSTYFFMYVQFGLTLSVAQFATLSILIGVLGRIWDGINDPLMGTIIDGAHFKWGKFKPWIFFGAVFTATFLLALFNIRPFGHQEIYGWIYVGIMVIVYLIWEAFFTMNDIGYWGAIPSLSRDRRRRDKLTSLVIVCAGIGNALTTFLVGVFSPGNILNAFTIYSLICAFIMVLCQTIVVLTVKEGPTDCMDVKEKASLKKTFKIIFRNKQLLWAALGYLLFDIGNGILNALIYNLYYLEYGYDGSFAIVMVIAGFATGLLQVLYPVITKRSARRTTQLISTIVMIIGYVFIALIGWTTFLPFNPITLAIGYIFIGCGGAYFYITTLINLTNCVEYNEYLTGERNEAVISSVRPLVVKFSSAFKSLITTVTLILSGLLVLSQNVSYLETQKKMINDRIISVDTSNSYEDLKFYITKINDYNSRIEGLDKDSNSYEEMLLYIEMEINSEASNGIMKKAQTNVEYLETYQKMYILKMDEKEVVEFKQIKDFTTSDLDTYFIDDYTYQASFVFSYKDENNKLVKVNTANEIYDSSKSIETRVALRIMVTILPIILISLSLFVQTKKFIISEGFYERMEKAIKEQKRG